MESQQLVFDFSSKTPADDLAEGKRALGQKLLRSYTDGLAALTWQARRKAARGLGKLGPEASEAVPLLEALLRNDRDFRVKKAAIQALDAIRPDPLLSPPAEG